MLRQHLRIAMLSCDLIRLLDRLLRLDCEFVPTNCHKFLSPAQLLNCLSDFRSFANAQDFTLPAQDFAWRFNIKLKTNGRWTPHLPFRCCSPGSVNVCLLALKGLFVAAHFDLLWFGFCPFGHGDLQDALFIA